LRIQISLASRVSKEFQSLGSLREKKSATDLLAFALCGGRETRLEGLAGSCFEEFRSA
jgi:hypothetical protein